MCQTKTPESRPASHRHTLSAEQHQSRLTETFQGVLSGALVDGEVLLSSGGGKEGKRKSLFSIIAHLTE